MDENTLEPGEYFANKHKLKEYSTIDSYHSYFGQLISKYFETEKVSSQQGKQSVLMLIEVESNRVIEILKTTDADHTEYLINELDIKPSKPNSIIKIYRDFLRTKGNLTEMNLFNPGDTGLVLAFDKYLTFLSSRKEELERPSLDNDVLDLSRIKLSHLPDEIDDLDLTVEQLVKLFEIYFKDYKVILTSTNRAALANCIYILTGFKPDKTLQRISQIRTSGKTDLGKLKDLTQIKTKLNQVLAQIGTEISAVNKQKSK